MSYASNLAVRLVGQAFNVVKEQEVRRQRMLRRIYEVSELYVTLNDIGGTQSRCDELRRELDFCGLQAKMMSIDLSVMRANLAVLAKCVDRMMRRMYPLELHRKFFIGPTLWEAPIRAALGKRKQWGLARIELRLGAPYCCVASQPLLDMIGSANQCSMLRRGKSNGELIVDCFGDSEAVLDEAIVTLSRICVGSD